MKNATYEADFYAWTVEQAKLLRQGRFADADIANIVEEIESLSRSETRAAESFARATGASAEVASAARPPRQQLEVDDYRTTAATAKASRRKS
jgi:hypothetical protein